ncbi:MAG: S8 family serine peptidase [Verrucomicrobiota bacterium JB022]|nr:S8 family serine peptidase [Verrucomicrobiota bacterium JB022]
MKQRTRSLLGGLTIGVALAPAWAAPRKMAGPGDFVPAFVNGDKAWFQDAMQDYHGPDRQGGDGPQGRVDFALVAMCHEWANFKATHPGQPFASEFRTLPVQGERILVEIACEPGADRAAMEAYLRAEGSEEVEWHGQTATAWLPFQKVGQAAERSEIRFMRPAYRTTFSGLVTTQGDKALRAPQARAQAPGFTGAGIRVGTLSDSFGRASAATSAAVDAANDDLPQGVLVLKDYGGVGSDEGRAMMQIVHDIAPGAEQVFHTAYNGQADFAEGIRRLAEAGCSIIVDDVFYFAEPFFQNGLIAQAVNEVAAQGVLYFSAAGNSGDRGYDAAFAPARSAGVSGGSLHDFNPGGAQDTLLQVTIPVGESVSFVLQWDDPFYSVSGAPGAATDLDLLVLGSGRGQNRILTASLSNNVGGDPVEIVSLSNDGSIDVDGKAGADTVFNLAIELFAGVAPERMKLIYFDQASSVTLDEYTEGGSTLVGHANTTGAIAVGASAYFYTPAYGVTPPRLNSYSSVGGTPLVIADDGTRLAVPLETRQPCITAPDGGNTTFFGQDLSSAYPAETDSYPNFFGTSAAAPHVAAVAALMLEKAGGPGSLIPKEVVDLLQATAWDMGEAGFDLSSGAGLVNAEAALSATPLSYTTWSRLTLGEERLPPGEDTDGDGKPNAVEYLIGTDPLIADAVAPLKLELDATGGGTLTVPLAPEADTSLAIVESSFDLVDWQPLPTMVVGERLEAAIEPAETPVFYRLRVRID